jgi:outer membrane protein
MCVLGITLALTGSAAHAQYSDEELLQQIEAEHAELQQRLSRPLSLDDCVDIALARNLPLDIARHERDIVGHGVSAAHGDWLPGLTVRTTRRREWSNFETPDVEPPVVAETTDTATGVTAALVQRLPLGGSVAFGYTFDDLSQEAASSFGGSFAVVQPLLRDAGWRKATSDVRDANLAADAEAWTLRARLLDIEFRVKSAYYEVLRRQKLVGVNERAIQRDEQLLAFSQAKVDAKLATRRDVLSAEIILEQDRGKLVNAQTEHRAALDALADVLGVRVQQPIDVVYVDVQPTTVQANEEAWVQRALRNNPDVQRARFDVQRDYLAMRVAGNDRLPRLDLGLSYDDARGPEILVGADRRTQRVWEGSITLSYPLLNKPLGSAYQQAQLRYQQGRRLLLEAERQVALDVRDSVRNLQRSEERIEVLQKTIEGSRDKVEFANVNFQLGRASNLDITDAQKDLTEAESDLVEEVMNHRVEFARLEKLLGGSLQ